MRSREAKFSLSLHCFSTGVYILFQSLNIVFIASLQSPFVLCDSRALSRTCFNMTSWYWIEKRMKWHLDFIRSGTWCSKHSMCFSTDACQWLRSQTSLPLLKVAYSLLFACIVCLCTAHLFYLPITHMPLLKCDTCMTTWWHHQIGDCTR
jgi:hypothetical protein